MLAERVRQRLAALDVVHHLAGDAGEDLVLGLLRQDVEGLHQWQAGIDHRGALPREHDDVAHRDAAAELEIDLELTRRGADLHHDHAVLAQVRDDIIAARQIDLVVDEFALERAGGELEDGHGSTPSRRLPARRQFGRARRRLLGAGRGFPVVHGRFADHPQELIRRRRDAQAFLLRHLAAEVELVQRIVQRLHAVLLPCLHRRLDLVDLVVADQGADRGRAHHDLGRHHAPPPLRLLQQRLREYASSTKASWARICDCWCAGKTSMMRLMLSIAELVCSVANAKWPVSAMVNAAAIVSKSRISPSSTTSGSWRSAYLSAAAKLDVSVPISRWLTMQL